MQRSVFNAGSAVRATASLCAPVTNTSTAVVIGLDSFSDVTLCRRSLLHNVHRIQPDDVTGTDGTGTDRQTDSQPDERTDGQTTQTDRQMTAGQTDRQPTKRLAHGANTNAV